MILTSDNCEECHCLRPNDQYFEDIAPDPEIEYSGDPDGDTIPTEEDWAEYRRRIVGTYAVITEDDCLDEDDESYSQDIKEIEVGGETIELKHTEYGYEELGEPYVISRDSFENEYQDFHKESLVYFEDDDVLSDEKDEIIFDREKVIGIEALNSFGEGSDDEDIVYVRNLSLSIDYEVVREHQSYKENVLSLTDEDDQKYQDALRYFGLNDKE